MLQMLSLTIQIFSHSGCFILSINSPLTFSLGSRNKIIMSISPWRISGAHWKKRERNHGDWFPKWGSHRMSMLASRAGYFCLASNIDNQSEKWLKIIIIPIPICSLRTQPHKNVAQALPQWHKSPEVSGKGRNQAMLLLKRSSQHQWLTHSADCQH